jgi:membrane fusion protein (multidrug efflux system)
MKARLLATLLLLLLPPIPAMADDAGSVQVITIPPKAGSVPDIVTAYGSAAPALDGGMTLSLQQDGRVDAIAVTPGETVRAGERLMDFSASAAASSTFQQAVSALALAKTQRVHTAQLLSQQLATRDQLAQADKAVSDAQATLDALQREGAGHTTQTLTAPFDGIVAAIPVAQGDHVQPGTALLNLTHLDGLVVTIGIEPSDRAHVHAGQPVRLSRLSDETAIEGHVLRIDGVLNPKTHQIDADVSVPAGTVISGEAFRADITVGRLEGWVVPHPAVLIDEKGAYVFQIVDNKAVRIAVTLVGSDGTNDVVKGPINAGRTLVIAGNYQLDDGMNVRSAPAGSATE